MGRNEHLTGVSIAHARKHHFVEYTVFATAHGRCYPRMSCFKLDVCNDVRSLSPDYASASGLRPCKKCNP